MIRSGRTLHLDGVDFEQGLGYHGLVTEFWYSCVLLCERNGIADSAGARPQEQRAKHELGD